MKNLRGAVLAAAALLASALSDGCASPGPALRALRASGPSRPGPEAYYRVDRFRIGWYDTATRAETPARLAALGFDSVLPYAARATMEEIREFLAEAKKAGIGVHLDITKGRSLEETGEPLADYVRALRDSPAILSWYLADEPEWRPKSTPRKLEASYSRIKALDPERPVSVIFILPGLSGAYRGAVDSLWIDWYPVSRRSREFAALRDGRYADRMRSFGRRADGYGLPLTIVPQGYGENEEGEHQFWRRLPTPAETRYMLWASFLARPEEIVYWTLYRTREDWLQGSLLPEVRAFRERFPDAVEYFPDSGFRFEGGRTDSILLGNGRGGLWLAVLAREGRERELRVEAPAGYAFAGAIGTSMDAIRKTSFRLEPYGVRLLEISEIP